MQRKISRNISLLKESISNASLKANIDPNQIALIAVSKKKSKVLTANSQKELDMMVNDEK